MKPLFSLLLCCVLLLGCGDKYDDSTLRNDLNDLENRVTTLEELCRWMNNDISALQKIVDALQKQITVTRIEEETNGYTIHFSDGQIATIRNGMNSGDAPVIGVRKDKDGIYYWTLNGSWLTDKDGNKVKAQCNTDVTPKLKIENDYWYISYDDGKSWTKLDKAKGDDGKDGKDGQNGQDGINGTNSVFKSVTQDDENVYFTLAADNSVITIPKGDNSKFAIAFDSTDIAVLNGGESQTIAYTITDATENTIIRAFAQDGWKVSVEATTTDRGTITVTAPDPIVESEILVFVNDGSYRTIMAALKCSEKLVLTIADSALNIDAQGGTQTVHITTNRDYSVEIPDNAKSWLSVVDSETRAAIREETITFNIAANTNISRFATVRLKDDRNNTLETIIVRQIGTCTEVHVETLGTLETVLADYDYTNIESLIITGVLNDVDFLLIRNNMPRLKNLDISEVNLSELPSKAFYESANVEHLVLPCTLTSIGENMCCNSKLKSVVIPQGVTSIGSSAFGQCTSLTSIEIPTSVKIIDDSAFTDCTALTSIEIPASVETIEAAAFRGCSSLKTVTFEKGSQLKTIGVKYDYLHYGAFSDCTALTSIEIPASVETIEAAAFRGCSSLKTVTFEKGSQLKTIGVKYNYLHYGAFSDCTALTSIEIPASVETIGTAAFRGCSSLKTVTFEKGSQPKIIDDHAFSDCTALTFIEIPASVETIEQCAFKGCYQLATVTFEKGSQLKTIKGGRVYDYSNKKYCYYGAFSDCPITSIEIPASVETIEEYAFYEYSSLVTVTFEKGSQLKTIGSWAFQRCPITSIEIPASVETIEVAAFKGCSSLKTVTFEKDSQLKVIDGRCDGYYYYGAFCELENLTTFDASACTQLTTIEDHAFYKDSKLSLFKIGAATPPKCSIAAFGYISSYSVLKVPSGCTDAYKKASGWNNFTSITGLDE